MNRVDLATRIISRLENEKARMRDDFSRKGRIRSTVIDSLLPEEIVTDIYEKFPRSDRMMVKRSIKENKLVGAQMDSFDPLLEEAVYAFQDARIVALVGEITGLSLLEPDTELYAGGISMMAKGGYLRPHLDNSHDGHQGRYRVLNLLFYVTPDWSEENGGSLQLWDDGPLTEPRTIPSLFNRLVIMATDRHSWHSVNEVVADGRRCCVSNYYFSSVSPEEGDYFHATSFRDEKAGVGDFIMRADNAVRTSILKTLPGVYKNPHVYKR